MNFEVIVSPLAVKHIGIHAKSGKKPLVAKILSLLEELREHPRSGTGKPEQLKHYKEETWSRRIDQRHRLVYEIRETELIVIAIAAYGHYDKK